MPRCNRGNTADENDYHTVTPNRVRYLGRWEESPHPRCFATTASSACHVRSNDALDAISVLCFIPKTTN